MTDKDYGGWCTNWAAYTVPQLWSFLQYESPDLSADQAGAWRKTAELLDYYRSELKMQRDELATKWPPERSPAAQVFVKYADELLSSMDKTAAQAYDNGQAVSGITLALADAKQKRAVGLAAAAQERGRHGDARHRYGGVPVHRSNAGT